MIDYVAFTKLDDALKFKLYEDAIVNHDHLKNVVTNLVERPVLPAVSPPVSPPVLPAATQQLQQPSVNQSAPAWGSGKMHLSLPKMGDFKAMVLGDSITSRVSADQIGPDILVRGFGGARVSDLCSRVDNSRMKKIEHITICIGINHLLTPECDIAATLQNYERLLY